MPEAQRTFIMPFADGSGEEGIGAMLVASHTHLLRLEISPEDAVRSAADGEVGLDYYRSEWSEEVQKALFEDVISLANDTRLPLVIHSREAFADTMACLGSARVPVVLHCFEGGEREVREASERGYYVGLAGNVTYRDSETARVLRLIDEERLLVETDAPYLSPQPVRGRKNTPENLVHTTGFVAERLGMEDEELATLTTRNARNLFGLPLEV